MDNQIDTPEKVPTMWNFAAIWNQSLDQNRQRPYEKREHIWASEITGSYYDRYWKMQGRTPTTPPNLRSRRKFEGGNIAEYVMQQVLYRAGILQSSQEYIVNEDYGIRVTGKADFTAGGSPRLLEDEDLLGLPESFIAIAKETIEHLTEKYPNGLKHLNIEIKSCSGMMFDSYERAPAVHHSMQAFHYAHNTDRPTLLVYVSRDDFRVCEWVIMPDSEKHLRIYKDDLDNMKKILTLDKGQILSYREPLLVWNEEDHKYKKNFKVEYSSYLTDYGFEQPSDYAEPAQKISTRINNVIKRLRAGAKMSKLNEAAMEDAIKFFPPCEEKLVKYINEWHVMDKPEPIKKEKKK
jgi:hypothetical protein